MQRCCQLTALSDADLRFYVHSIIQASEQQGCSSHLNRCSLFIEHQTVPCLQAESVNELVGARTAAAADSALAGLTGGIGATVQRLRLSALTLLAELEVWAAVKCPVVSVRDCVPAMKLPAMLTCLVSHAGITLLSEQYLYCTLAVVAVTMMPGMLLQGTCMLKLTTSM